MPLRKHLQKLESFHNRCIRAILGISDEMHWKQHISSEEVWRRRGDSRSITTMVSQRRLAWLGHLGRLVCPQDGSLQLAASISTWRWITQVMERCASKDLKDLSISEAKWYERTQDRAGWCYQCQPDNDDDAKQPQQQPQADPS